jgi:hypothetical protein
VAYEEQPLASTEGRYGSAREPEGTGGSAAAEGAGASAAAERTRSGRRSLPPRRLDGVLRGQRYADWRLDAAPRCYYLFLRATLHPLTLLPS